MSGMAIVLMSLGLASIALWLNANLNAREKALYEQVQAFKQQQNDFDVRQRSQAMQLDERFRQALAVENKLKQQQSQLNEYASQVNAQQVQWLQDKKVLEAKLKKARQEGQNARQRAKRLQSKQGQQAVEDHR